MSYLIFGKGYIAQQFKAFLGEEAEISEHYVGDYSALKKHLQEEAPEVLINCAGKTGRPNVDWCEDHKVETLFSNVTVPLLMAQACDELGIYMVHVGSGCVYEGDNGGLGWTEEDTPNFFGSFYSRTKAMSEALLKDLPVLQLRLRMPFDSAPHPRNFITKVAAYERVISVANSISVLEDFLQASKVLIETRATGIYNMTNPGAIDHETILSIYKNMVDGDHSYQLISLEELSTLTKAGRSNCLLNTDKVEAVMSEAGVPYRRVEDAVRDALQKYAQLI